MWEAFQTSYLKGYLACLVLGAFLAYCWDVLDLQASVVLDDCWAYCSVGSWVHHVGWGPFFETFQMAFLVRLEASLEHQEEGQAYFVSKEDLHLAFLGAYLVCFEASLVRPGASLVHLRASLVHLVAFLVFLGAFLACFQVQKKASFFHLLGSLMGHLLAYLVHQEPFLVPLGAFLVFLVLLGAFLVHLGAFLVLLGAFLASWNQYLASLDPQETLVSVNHPEH